MILRRCAGGLLIALAVVGCRDTRPSDDLVEHVGQSRSAIVGATGPSPVSEDFIVWLSRKDTTKNCTGALIAPNLVVTTKQCLYEASTAGAICAATGDPAPGSVTGYVTAAVPPSELVVFTGESGRSRWKDGVDAPDAVGQKVVDDQSLSLCGHDLAFLVLDRSLTNLPIGRLRLSPRPEVGITSPLALAGWGKIDSGVFPLIRMRRTGIGLQRVGAAAPVEGDTGSLVPRTFETGAAACIGDVGSPAFDPSTNAIVGVLSRGLNGDPAVPEECASEAFVNVYMTISDFPSLIRQAFKDANAEPWLEKHDAAGFVRFGEACQSDVECEGNLCAGATSTSAGVCNVSCAKDGGTCPTGYVCGSSGACETPAPVPPSPGPAADPSSPETEDDVVSASGGGCSIVRGRASSSPISNLAGFGVAIIAACAAFRRGLILGRHRRRA